MKNKISHFLRTKEMAPYKKKKVNIYVYGTFRYTLFG